MNKKCKPLYALAFGFLLISGYSSTNESIPEEKYVGDEPVFKEMALANISRPNFASEDDDDEGEEKVIADRVILHYVNEDKDCLGRAFYIWCPGVDGNEYNADNIPDGFITYEADGTGMTIDLDLASETSPFHELYGTSTLMYIIKYRKQGANENWGGQSEDVELRYADFGLNAEKTCEVWCTPAAGGGIAQFDSEEKTKVDGIKLAKFTSFKTINCTLTDNSKTVNWSLYAFDETYFKVKPKERGAIQKNYLVDEGSTSQKNFDINFTYDAHINVVYTLVSYDTSSTTGLTKTVNVSYENLYNFVRFTKYYTTKINDLGMTYNAETGEATFKVWAPTAANVSLLVYSSNTSEAYGGNDSYKGFHMSYTAGGVWAVKLKEVKKQPIKGLYYNYQVDNTLGTNVCMDPYATTCGTSGVRGMIYDTNDTNPNGWTNEQFDSVFPIKWDGKTEWTSSLGGFDKANLDIKTPQELTVYEVHVQDFTGDSSWKSNKGNRNGTYNAFVEKGTKLEGTDISTGFDHLNELGINAVQFVPVFDSDNDESTVLKAPGTDEYAGTVKYNWGYNPLNYNCVEGGYCSDPSDGLVRIREFKNMIYELAHTYAHTRVIMDVVYNHVSSPSASCFNKLMPRYFFRYDENGELYDGSGCHNEFKTEAIMARKFIVDSITMWAKEYRIKGFRFDLMGLIDTKTMKAVKEACYEIDPDIVLYGEGWTSGGFHGGLDPEWGIQSQGTFCCDGLGSQVYTDPDLYNTTNACILGGFNDKGRNALKGGNDQGWGSNSSLPGDGFLQNNGSEFYRDAITQMIYGEHYNVGANPKQTINYASCHDNWTLTDQLYYTYGNRNNVGGSTQNVLRGVETGFASIFASNGVAFMLGGEELLRTKFVCDADKLETMGEKYTKIPKNSYENVYGHLISHNSYNSPLEVNSFKWGNKKEVSLYDNAKINTSLDDNNNLTKKFKELIAVHKAMPKLDMTGCDALKNAGNIVWGGGEGYDNLNGLGIQFGDYFIFIAGGRGTYFKNDYSSWQLLFECGLNGEDPVNHTINVGDLDGDGSGFACRIYKR